MRHGYLLCACAMLTACGQQGSQKPVALKPVAAKVEKKGSPPKARIPVEHRSNSLWWNASCEANWDERCEGSQIVSADPGWQVCNAVYTVVTQDGHDAWFRVEPNNFYPGDPERPARFHGIKWTIHAFGNGNVFDHRGSKTVVQNIHVDMIPFSANNYLRAQENCWMPAG